MLVNRIDADESVRHPRYDPHVRGIADRIRWILEARNISERELSTTAGNLIYFVNAGSSGELVQNSIARTCGVVTGRFDYSNSGGGVGHAISVVGLFDLPQNRAR